MKRAVGLGLGTVAVMGLAAIHPLDKPAAQTALPKASPLAAYAGFGHNQLADEARYIREEAERERVTAACMRDAGFQYSSAPAVTISGPRLNPNDKVAGPIDQNERYARSLPDDKRRDYYQALYGVPDPNDQSNLWNPQSETGGGCSGAALRSIPGVYAARSALAEEFETMLADVRAHSRVKQAETKWAECARGQGLNFASPAEAYADLDLNPQNAATRAQPIASCIASSGLGDIAADVRAEYEARFVSQHKSTLDRKKSAI